MTLTAVAIRAAVAVVLLSAVFGEAGFTPVAFLAVAFLITVVWSPLTRHERT